MDPRNLRGQIIQDFLDRPDTEAPTPEESTVPQFDEAAFQRSYVPDRGMLVNPPQPLDLPEPSASEEFSSFFKELPLTMKLGILASDGLPTLATHFLSQRQSKAQAIQDLQAKQQQQHMDDFLKMDQHLKDNPEQWDQQMKLQAAQGNPYANAALQVGDKKLMGEYSAVTPLIQTYFPDFAKRFAQDPKSVGRSELRAVVTNAAKMKERRAAADADAQELNVLENGYQNYLKNGTPMNPGDQERLLELRTAQQTKALQLEKLRMGLELDKKKLNAPAPDEKITNSDLFGHDREAITQEMFGKRYGTNVLFKQLTPDEKAKVNDALVTRQGQMTGSRITGQQAALGMVPVGQLGKSQNYRDPVTGKAAPSWANQQDLQRMGAVEVENPQIQTVTQLTNVDEAMKEILKAGSAITRKATGTGLFDVPAGMAQTPIVNLLKKYAGDPDVALLQSAINRITPTLSKLGGDTANVAVEERKIYADSIFQPSDTLQSFSAKVRSIMNAQKRTREAMGFIPDERTYLQKLIARGLSDKEIEALVQERRRTFH